MSCHITGQTHLLALLHNIWKETALGSKLCSVRA
jgi:hypothetical protein